MKQLFKTILVIIIMVILTTITVSCSKPYIEEHPSSAKAIKDDRFIDHGDGVVLDTKTGLMWGNKDNGNDTKWHDAKFYCENYHGGGYKDWRMPTLQELESLYDEHKIQPVACSNSNNVHIATGSINITCLNLWSSETSTTTNECAIFNFGSGTRSAYACQMTFARALPVRSVSR